METPALFNRASDTEASLHIYGPIGDYGISAQAVADALVQAKGVKTLRLFVDSPGGDLMAGKAIYNQLARFGQGAQVVATVDGLAASAASFMIMSASRIFMAPQSTMMIHEAHSAMAGKAADLRKLADVLEAETANIAAIYAKRSGKSVDEIASMLSAETWLSAEEAVAAGLADEVLTEVENASAVTVQAEAPQDRVVNHLRDRRMAAMWAETKRIQNLRGSASRATIPGQPGHAASNDKEHRNDA